MSNPTKLRIVAVLAVVAIFAIYLRRRESKLPLPSDKAPAQMQMRTPAHATSERPLDREFKSAMQRESALVSHDR